MWVNWCSKTPMKISALGKGNSKKKITLGAFDNIKTGILRHWKWLGSRAVGRAASQPQLISKKRQKFRRRKLNTAQCSKTARIGGNCFAGPPSQSPQTPKNLNFLQLPCLCQEKSWVGIVQVVPAILEGNLAAPTVRSLRPAQNILCPCTSRAGGCCLPVLCIEKKQWNPFQFCL